jgi:hypothetical protein
MTDSPAYPLAHLIAGVISTFPPHDTEHPETCLPIATAILAALAADGHLVAPRPPERTDQLVITVKFPVPVNEFCDYLNLVDKYHPGLSVDMSGPGGWKLDVPASE